MGESRAELIKRAKHVLRGQDATPEELLALAKQLKGKQAFDYARRLLVKARALPIESREGRTEIDQQCALCTYKDPDLPLDTRLEAALYLLKGALEEAEVYLARVLCDGAQVNDATTHDTQETFGITGAIYKRKWQRDAHLPDLVQSFAYYEKGYRLGPRADQGYTGINAAFVLDLLAEQEESQSGGNAATIEAAAKRREQAEQICHHIIDTFTPPAGADSGRGKTRPAAQLPRDWWTLVTVAEAHFGLRNYEDAGVWLRAAATLEEELRGTGQEVQRWEHETTVKQLAELARVHHGRRTSATDLSESPAWKVLRLFVGAEKEAGVRRAFSGKVGLALSGGGFRASLFHIGVLARLAELDMLRHVEALSCVSGGSIIGAHYYLEVRRLLESTPDGTVARQDYIALVERLERDFLAVVQSNPRMRAFAGPHHAGTLRMLLPRRTRTTRMAEVLDEDLYAPVARRLGGDPSSKSVPLSKLFIRPAGESPDFEPKYDNWRRRNKVPILLLNAATLNTGHNWQFAASWMGEPAASIETQIDGNERLRRMYYDEAPEPYRTFPLGLAVTASACVPGLFRPVTLRGLYTDRTVQLVDGGLHDNQGVSGLLEQECTVLLISDASGQMTTKGRPMPWAAPVPVRSNSVLMARVREAEFKELRARRRAGLLQGLMFLHLKKDLAVESVDWTDCDDPKESVANGGVPISPLHLTSYGIRADVQNLPSDIRTDLDAFCEAEAFALMTSGYRMAEREFRRGVPTFAATEESPHPWRFLAAEPLMVETAGVRPFTRVLGVASERLLKPLRVHGRFRLWLCLALLPVIALILMNPLEHLLVLIGVIFGAWALGILYALSRLLDRWYLRLGSLQRLRAERPFQIPLGRGMAAAVRVSRVPELWVALQQLRVTTGRPVVAFCGGAAEVEESHVDAIAPSSPVCSYPSCKSTTAP